MTDFYDRASDAEELHREAAIAAQRSKTEVDAAAWRRVSAKWCEGPACGVRIPDERRRAIPGVRLCVQCQSDKEQKERLER